MSFTYDLSTDIGKTRRDTGDTASDTAFLSDEEIQSILDDYSTSLANAAVRCCEIILAKIAKQIDRSVVGINSSRSQLTQHYQDLLKTLKIRAAESGGITAYAGGISESRIDTAESDSDYTPPQFGVGRDDYGTTQPEVEDD